MRLNLHIQRLLECLLRPGVGGFAVERRAGCPRAYRACFSRQREGRNAWLAHDSNPSLTARPGASGGVRQAAGGVVTNRLDPNALTGFSETTGATPVWLSRRDFSEATTTKQHVPPRVGPQAAGGWAGFLTRVVGVACVSRHDERSIPRTHRRSGGMGE